MKHEVLHKVLSCKSLPSLPAVALRVIEQTSDPNIKLSELATTIQNDQGLAAKVLKTVNSSFYGLRTPCSTINKALVLMGLAPVKTLVLGFSLVNAVNDRRGAGSFNYVAYWRRGMYTAVAAKAIAEAARKKWSDEAFLAGLLQDIGVVALFNALGPEYLAVTEQAEDHRQLSRQEAELLDITHPEIGAMLAERWKLPTELVMPVRYHERPTAAPQEHGEMCRCVGLANIVHDVLTDEDPHPEMARLYERASQWFNLDNAAVDAMVRRCSDGAREMSRLFNLDTGAFKNVDELMETAIERQSQVEVIEAAPEGVDPLGALLKNASDFDPLTGVYARGSFTALVRAAIATPVISGKAATLIHVGIDAPADGQPVSEADSDERVVRVANVLTRHFGVKGMAVCRLSSDLFAVVLSSADERLMNATIDSIRRELATIRPTVTVSMGVARYGAGVTTPHEFVVAATKSLHSARQRGGNAVHTSARAA